jgi:hypothetical protein
LWGFSVVVCSDTQTPLAGQIIREEYLRFLTERGDAEHHKTRPVWMWTDGEVITQKEAEEVLGAKAKVVFGEPESTNKFHRNTSCCTYLPVSW